MVQATRTLADVHRRIASCQRDGAQRAVTLCFFGDSNTRGMAIDPDRHRRAFPARLLAELMDRYAPCAFQGIDAGLPGDTLTAALQRLDDDVLRHAPDLTILAFALNDAVQGGQDGVKRYEASLHAALNQLLPTSAVILPRHIRLYILRSPRKDQKGYWKVAGRFFSMKKCPIHARP